MTESLVQPKNIWLKEQLRKRILRLTPGKTLPTIAEIRKEYGVSQPTVDRALHALRMEGLIICRRGSGIIVTERAKEIRLGLVFGASMPELPSIRFFSLLFNQFQALSTRWQIPLRYYFVAPDDHSEHGLNQLQADMASREICCAITISVMPRWSWWDVPTISLAANDTLPNHVYLDSTMVVRMGIDALARRGCRNIALMCHAFSPMHEREIAAFIDHLADSGLQTRPEWVFAMDTGYTPVELWGYQDFQQRWDDWQERPDGLISVDDNATLGLLHCAEALGVDLQRDLQVASHANVGSPVLDGMPVIRIAFDPEEIATVMKERVEHLLLSGESSLPAVVIHPHLLDPVNVGA